MRYSLSTLMSIVLLMASLVATWMRRDSWYLHRTTVANAPSIKRLRNISPDGTRILCETQRQRNADLSISMLDKDPHSGVLKKIDVGLWQFVEFRDDDTLDIYFYEGSPIKYLISEVATYSLHTYRRRYPEWWWGHFYRPEVWASVAFGIIRLVRTTRALRRKMAGT